MTVADLPGYHAKFAGVDNARHACRRSLGGIEGVTSIDVVVADDHPYIIRGVRDFLKSTSNIRVVDTCSDGARKLE